MKVGQSVSHPVQNSESSSSKSGVGAASSQDTKRAERSDKADRTEKTDKADGPARSSANQGAKAEISSKAKEFVQAKAVATQTPDIREDKVSDLKKRISEGTYKVDEEAIADRMVDEHLRGPMTR